MVSKIIKTSANTTISSAAKIMDKHNIGSLLIEDNENMIGIITERDILKKIVAQGRDAKTTSVRDIIDQPLITIDSEKGVEEADKLMSMHKIRRLPVVTKGKIVGIVTIRDVSKGLRYSLGKRISDSRGSDYFRPSYGKPE